MLKVGEVAPPFIARATNGIEVSMEALRGRPVVLYFFPKAFTPSCTIETRGFRDNYAEIKALGLEVIGVSTDTFETQCRFAEKHGVTFPMIADTDKSIARAYKVLWPLLPLARRVTFVLDEQHRVLAVYNHEFQVSKHLDDVLRFAQKWKKNSP